MYFFIIQLAMMQLWNESPKRVVPFPQGILQRFSRKEIKVFRKTVPVVLAVVLGFSGCSLLGGGLGVGDTAEGDLKAGVDIDELLPDAEEVLPAFGIAVEDDWPAVEFSLKSGDGVSLFVEADDIDPVMVVVDAEGGIVSVGNDWDQELDAFISLDEVPGGARVIVFDNTGDDGEFVLELGEPEDYAWKLETGMEVELTALEDKENDRWEDLLNDVDELYRTDWETCRVMPLEVRGEKWIRIAVSSDVDCVMAVLQVVDGELEYRDYDDDTDDMNPVFSGMLEQGDYIVVVDSYSDSEDAEFTISVEELDPEDMAVEVVSADRMDEWFSGEFHEGALVMSYWPEAGDYYGIFPEDPALVFEFEIEEEGEYLFEVSCSDDTKMAILDSQNVMVDYNDDGPEGTLDPELTLQLAPGFYSAVIAPYASSSEYVDFRYTLAAPVVRERGMVPMEDTFQMHSNVYMSMMFESGNTYEIFAESDDIDLTLTVVDRAGEEYFSDDDGGDFNPYLEIECTRANAGEWEIDLESYAGGDINGEVYFVARPVQHSGGDDTVAPVQVDI